ncbi:MAG: NAD-dependent epimerase/dehydratase family protein [Bacteroidota bacterium]
MQQDTILVIGANGQIGSVLTRKLRQLYGTDRVIASDLRQAEATEGPFEQLDIMDAKSLQAVARKHKVTQVFHLAAILSAKGESMPKVAWDLNTQGLFNVLEMVRERKQRLFFPSTIAVFGDTTPRIVTPQHTVMQPTTVYGISKVAGENWCQYYHQRYGVDVRSIRYPGIIGHASMPGGGTTDYAVDIFHYAAQDQPYTCFLAADACLPMLYMDDAIRATLEIMSAPADQVKVRTSYNVSGLSFTPAELVKTIQRYKPDFTADYAPDFRQAIAASWPQSLDDRRAREDWGWAPAYDLDRMTAEMLEHLHRRYQPSALV